MGKLRKGSLIDDVDVRGWWGDGPPILFTNPQIRKMLNLSKAGKDDVFFDLGSGWGQNLIIAASEFGVKRCVGVENSKARCQKARGRIKKWENEDRIKIDQIKIINCSYIDVIEAKVRNVKLSDATVIFFGLDDLRAWKIMRRNDLPRRGCRFVYYNLTLFPDIMPDENGVDNPFYVSTAPFNPPKSKLEWLRAVVGIERPFLLTKEIQELRDELSHDYNVEEQSQKAIERYGIQFRT